jgi:hypothetical protein
LGEHTKIVDFRVVLSSPIPELGKSPVSFNALKKKVKKETLAAVLDHAEALCAQCRKPHPGKECLYLNCGCIVHPTCLKEGLRKLKRTLEEAKSHILSIFECPEHKLRLPLGVVRSLFPASEREQLSCEYVDSMNKGEHHRLALSQEETPYHQLLHLSPL